MGNLDAFSPWITAVILLGPLLIPRIPPLLRWLVRVIASPRSAFVCSADGSVPSPLTVAFVILHAVYHLAFLIKPEPDVFRLAGNLPLFAAPLAYLRARLITTDAVAGSSGDQLLLFNEHPLDPVLARLTTYDARANYARFGHVTTVGAAEWAAAGSGQDLLAFHTVLDVALPYIAEILVIAAVAALSGKERRWRRPLTWLLFVLAIGELAWTVFGQIDLPGNRGDGFRLHSQLANYRHLVLLPLPALLLFILPPPAPPAAPTALTTTLPLLLAPAEALLTHLRLASLTRHAVLSNEFVREAAVEQADSRADDAAFAREDPDVIRAGEKVGLTGEEGVVGGLREGAEAFLKQARKIVEQSKEASSSGGGGSTAA